MCKKKNNKPRYRIRQKLPVIVEEEKITVSEWYRRKGIEPPFVCGFFGHDEPYYGS